MILFISPLGASVSQKGMSCYALAVDGCSLAGMVSVDSIHMCCIPAPHHFQRLGLRSCLVAVGARGRTALPAGCLHWALLSSEALIFSFVVGRRERTWA